jgi:hypothetical protein
MTGPEEHLVRTLAALCSKKFRGRVTLNACDCQTLLSLYEAAPGYARWDEPVATAVKLTRLLTDPLAGERRAALLSALRRGAEGRTTLACRSEMAGELLCLFDIDARSEAEELASRQ